MSILVSIDPGLRCLGAAKWRNGKLVKCDALYCNEGDGPIQWRAMVNTVKEWHGRGKINTLIIEQMQTRKKYPGSHDNLLGLATLSGGIWATLKWEEGISVLPREWTGFNEKAINARRVRKRLSEEELALMDYELAGVMACNKKEIYDAVGIGLYALERL